MLFLVGRDKLTNEPNSVKISYFPIYATMIINHLEYLIQTLFIALILFTVCRVSIGTFVPLTGFLSSVCN